MPIKAIIVAEGEYVETVEWPTQAEFDAFREGVEKGADLYGCGSIGVYTLQSLSELSDNKWDQEMAELIRKYLPTEGS